MNNKQNTHRTRCQLIELCTLIYKEKWKKSRTTTLLQYSVCSIESASMAPFPPPLRENFGYKCLFDLSVICIKQTHTPLVIKTKNTNISKTSSSTNTPNGMPNAFWVMLNVFWRENSLDRYKNIIFDVQCLPYCKWPPSQLWWSSWWWWWCFPAHIITPCLVTIFMHY